MTTDNLPAVPAPEPSREVTRADTDSWIQVVGDVSRFASMIAGTEFVPRSLRDSPAATAAAILYGREVGLPPMTALTQTHVIEGKPSMSAEGMRALVLAAGHDLVVEETTMAVCRMKARRRGGEAWTTLTWSVDQARQAGLLGRGPWKAYPRQMLQARCTTELVRLVFPDVIHGFRSVEEMEDVGGEEMGALDAAAAAGQQPTTRVTRAGKKTTAKRAPAALPPVAERPEPVAGPPLPGEDGYSDQTSAGETGDGPSASRAEGTGEADEAAPADVVDGTVAEPSDSDPSTGPGAGGDEPGPVEAPADEPPAERTPPKSMSRAQQRMIMARLGELGVEPDDREERLLILGALTNRELTTSNDLTSNDARHVIDTLASVSDKAELNALLDALDQAASS